MHCVKYRPMSNIFTTITMPQSAQNNAYQENYKAYEKPNA